MIRGDWKAGEIRPGQVVVQLRSSLVAHRRKIGAVGGRVFVNCHLVGFHRRSVVLDLLGRVFRIIGGREWREVVVMVVVVLPRGLTNLDAEDRRGHAGRRLTKLDSKR